MFIHAKNNTAYLMGNADQMICGNFTIHVNALFKHTAYYSDTAVVFYATFQRRSFLKLLNRLTVGWNTTQCKAAGFFLFSLHFLAHQFSVYFPLHVFQ